MSPTPLLVTSSSGLPPILPTLREIQTQSQTQSLVTIERIIHSPATKKDLTQVLELLTQKIGGMPTLKNKSLIKPCVPDTFNGSYLHKLEAFLFQCQVYLAVHSGDFLDNESCVTFILSYLKESPQDWFQSELSHSVTSGQLPKWFSSYQDFTSELQHIFGPHDPITDAMNSLESLKFKDSGKATRYTINFNQHARKTGWNKQALFHQFYKGLPDRLKNEIAHIRKPVGLKDLQDLVATLNQRYPQSTLLGMPIGDQQGQEVIQCYFLLIHF